MGKLPTTTPTDCDVAIVGAGASGMYLATLYAEAGKTVRVFEAGPAWQLQDLVSSQIWARRLKWGGGAVARGGSHPMGHNMAMGWGLGGAALHHYAGWPRLRPEDFELRSRFGRGLDWPFGYDELRPYYDRIQDEIGIAGDADSEETRPPGAPYPMPPIPGFTQSRVLARGFEKRGLKVSAAPTAVNSVPYKGRAGCLYDGWCDAGCPIGALANPLVLHYDRAIKAGVSFHTSSPVQQLHSDKSGRVTSLQYLDENAAVQHCSASLFVLAGSSVQNARLMLHSKSAAHRQGLGNQSGLLGRYFACHTLVTTYGIMDEPMDNHLGLSAGQHISFSEYGKERKNGPFGSYFLGFGAALKPNDILGIANTRPDLMGTDLHRFMQDEGKRLTTITAECENVAARDNQVRLDSSNDSFGFPGAHIEHNLDEQALALWEHARSTAEDCMRASGAKQVWSTPMVTVHPMGGTIMGSDPAHSVTDGHGLVHDAGNLLVTGAGLFPSGGAVGPTFTIYALTLRAAEHTLAQWGQLTQSS
tara:strand:+ start:138302 stop:139891 length:1590 start_codon:yes stop_codon:yes gene_type:complete